MLTSVQCSHHILLSRLTDTNSLNFSVLIYLKIYKTIKLISDANTNALFFLFVFRQIRRVAQNHLWFFLLNIYYCSLIRQKYFIFHYLIDYYQYDNTHHTCINHSFRVINLADDQDL